MLCLYTIQIDNQYIILDGRAYSEMQGVPDQEFNQFIISIKSGCRILERIEEYLQKYGGEIVNKLETQLRQPPLYFAINLPDDDTCLAVIGRLVEKGANPHFKDQNQQTIIFYACRDGKSLCVDYLVSLGVSLLEEDAYGQTPLYYIANQNQLHLVHIYDKPQHYNHVDKLAQQTPLYYAAKKGHLQMCKLLVENGCDVSHHDAHNKTAVEYARRARYHEVTEFLAAQTKKAKDSNTKVNHHEASKEQARQHHQSPQQKKVAVKKQIEVENSVNTPRSFFKIVFINDQGQTKDLTEEEVRSMVREAPGLQPLLAYPGSIPREALEADKINDQKEKWQKVATRVLANCWKHKGSVWFHQPVDPVKFGIMDYYDIVTRPMDLGTIKKKLAYNFYASVQKFAADVKLVWDNCYKYNGTDHQISLCAKQVQHLFWSLYESELRTYEAK